MQFRDLNAQYNALKDEIDAAMISVATKGDFILGKSVAELESRLAEYAGVKHCVTCANGTDAISMTMMAWKIGPGDAVFVPDFTFFATGEAVSLAGATPIFVDVSSDTFNIDPNKLEEQIKRVLLEGVLVPRAIIPVDLFGLPANYPVIERIARSYNLLILEDGAQGFGGNINGRRACSFGDAATTSFFPAKPLGCYGDGGAIFTNDDDLADLLKSIRSHGKGIDKYDNVRIGLNSRLDTMQAAILIVKLKAFIAYELDKVNLCAERYTLLLSGLVKTPVIPDGFYSSWAQYTIKLNNRKERDNVQSTLRDMAVPSMVYYPRPMHMQTAFAQTSTQNTVHYKDYPVTDMLCSCVLSLPIHPYISFDDINKVSNGVMSALK